jgi:mannosyl-3-phosphoglycerate phosphatase
VKTIALGDSPNDISMLKKADHPVLVRSMRDHPGIEKDIPHLRTTDKKGPAGWNAAITALLAGK